MTPEQTPEYRALELDSSNEIMDHDSRMGLGRYAQAREHARRAGVGRRAMGQMLGAAGSYANAAEDYLSAAACFLLAGDGAPMAECVARVRELADAGRIPTDRLDLCDTLAEREAELRNLLAATPSAGPVAVPSAAVPAPQP